MFNALLLAVCYGKDDENGCYADHKNVDWVFEHKVKRPEIVKAF